MRNAPIMSSDEVKAKAKETLRSVKELVKAVETSVHKELGKNAPKVVNTLDRSFERASTGLAETLRTIDKRTGREQLELLKAYKSFLQRQTDMIQARIAALEREPTKA